jgi:hypothetical protein
MTRTLAVLAGAMTFLLCLVAIRDHAALVQAGYEISGLERTQERLTMHSARARELVNRLSSPAVLSEKARELGLVTGQMQEHAVVRIGADKTEEPLLVKSE